MKGLAKRPGGEGSAVQPVFDPTIRVGSRSFDYILVMSTRPFQFLAPVAHAFDHNISGIPPAIVFLGTSDETLSAFPDRRPRRRSRFRGWIRALSEQARGACPDRGERRNHKRRPPPRQKRFARHDRGIRGLSMSAMFSHGDGA